MRRLILTAIMLCTSGVCLAETTDEMIKRKEATRERAKRIKAQAKEPITTTKSIATKKPLPPRTDIPDFTLGAGQTAGPNLSASGNELTPFDLPPILGSGGKSPPGFITPTPVPNVASPVPPCAGGFGPPPGMGPPPTN